MSTGLMSIKIYDAYKIDGDIYRTFELLKKKRDTVAKAVDEQCYNEMLWHMVRYFDCEESEQVMYSVYNAHAWLRDAYKSRDTTLEVCSAIFPVTKKVTLFQNFFGEFNHRIAPMFECDGYFEYFGYWNNSDLPEDITDKQWEKRQKTWEKAYGADNSLWTSCGYSLVFYYHNQYLPTLDGAKLRELTSAPDFNFGRQRRIFMRNHYKKKDAARVRGETVSNFTKWEDKFSNGDFDDEIRQIKLQPFDIEKRL